MALITAELTFDSKYFPLFALSFFNLMHVYHNVYV